VTLRGDPNLTICGRRSVLEALASDLVEVERVMVSRTTPKPFRKELAAACRARGLSPDEADARAVSDASRDPRHDQGVVARIRLVAVTDAQALVDTLKGARAKRPTRLLALENVTNPQNVGMIVRSVVAGALDGVLWPTGGAPWVSGLVVKASAGTLYRCPIVRCDSLEEGLWTLGRGGFEVVGLRAGDAEDLWTHAPAHRAVYTLGSETTGISEPIAALVDRWIAIPMPGPAESLNVAVTAGVVCMALARDAVQ
jgi:23S rRNA (guanosine2251-2'-O)-methyltransferase